MNTESSVSGEIIKLGALSSFPYKFHDITVPIQAAEFRNGLIWLIGLCTWVKWPWTAVHGAIAVVLLLLKVFLPVVVK